MSSPQPTHRPAIAHREAGKGRGVLLVHGWMVSGSVWNRVLPWLAGYRAILPDLRGSGASGHAPTGSVTLHDYLADLVELCEHLELHDMHLVGHSMGGQLATLLAATLPERFATLTLLNPVPVEGLAFPDTLQALFRNCGGDAASIGRIVDLCCRRLDAAGRTLLLEDALKIAPAVISTGFEAFRRGDARVSLDRIAARATVVATDDAFLPAAFLQEAVVSRLPSAQLEYLAGPGHYPQMEMPEETAALLRTVFG